MGRIRLLPDDVASQVAAGEVVERPASVAKELVENSLDAGASRVDLEWHRGGTGFLSVADDGCGMDREDALLCLERHATSKIRSSADIAAVGTFGFRGEAIPSIASVSRFRLCTRPHGAAAGTEITVAGGRIEAVRDSGEAEGTRIEVRQLFYNVPARRKFLKGERTEAAHIEHAFQVIALANPGVRFSLRRDGASPRVLAPAQSLEERARDLFGAEFASRLFDFPGGEHNGVGLRGMLAKPGHGRGDRSQQYIFVNGRPVFSTAVYQPLREAYGSSLPKGMHPPAILFLEIAPDWVDCNVHPAKREVRFRDAISVREAVHFLVRRALETRQAAATAFGRVSDLPAASVFPEAAPASAPAGQGSPARVDPAPAPVLAPVSNPEPSVRIVAPREPAPSPSLGLAGGAPEDSRRFKFVGSLSDRYAVLEDADGLVLLDNRSARERITYESLLARIASGDADCQRLLIPVVVELAPKDFAWVHENAAVLASAGLLAEPFGQGAVKIDGVPPVLAAHPAGDVLLRLADDVRTAGRPAKLRAVEEAVARSVCRTAALPPVPRDAADLDALMTALMACEMPYTCPNGKPTMIHFAFSELERKFGRSR